MFHRRPLRITSSFHDHQTAQGLICMRNTHSVSHLICDVASVSELAVERNLGSIGELQMSGDATIVRKYVASIPLL